MLDRFANLTGARPVFLPPPGVVKNPRGRRAPIRDPAVITVLQSWRHLTVAVVSVESVQHPSHLQNSGTGNHLDQQTELRELGAFGQICLRYFDQGGTWLAPHITIESWASVSSS